MKKNNTNLDIFLLCPIPENQKPMNQYIELKEGFFSSWPLKEEKEFNSSIFSFFFFSIFLLFSPIFYQFIFSIFSSVYLGSFINFFIGTIEFIQFFFFNLFLTNCFFSFFFFILLIRWKNLEKSFFEPFVIYEESSWYDGQVWEKPMLIIKNDLFIATFKIRPVLKKISKILNISLFFSTFFFIFLKSAIIN